jgi:hypothetical protein
MKTAEKVKKTKKLPVFSKRCFWEQDYEKLNFNKGKKYIITKVISYGSQNDYIELFKYYGWDVVKDEVLTINYLNRKILNFLSILFEIDKTKFKAYGKGNMF